MKDFELLPHTADIKLRVYGATLNDLFRHALIGMFQSIGPIAPQCTRENDRLVCPSLPVTHEIDIQAPRLDMLLVDFLSEALYLSDINNQAYLDAEVSITDTNHIRAKIHGIEIDGFQVVEIKAVTYHDLEILTQDDGYQVDIVFDI